MLGSCGGIVFPIFVGALLDHSKHTAAGESGAYALVFGLCGSAYLVAFVLSHLLAPRFDRIVLRTTS